MSGFISQQKQELKEIVSIAISPLKKKVIKNQYKF